jgi:phosphomannomutase
MNDTSSLIVSVSGVRGLIGKGLTADVGARFAAAFGAFLRQQHLSASIETTPLPLRVVLSRDSRPSGAMLRHAVIAGLLEVGCIVEDIGIASTPTCGFAVR